MPPPRPVLYHGLRSLPNEVMNYGLQFLRSSLETQLGKVVVPNPDNRASFANVFFRKFALDWIFPSDYAEGKKYRSEPHYIAALRHGRLLRLCLSVGQCSLCFRPRSLPKRLFELTYFPAKDCSDECFWSSKKSFAIPPFSSQRSLRD